LTAFRLYSALAAILTAVIGGLALWAVLGDDGQSNAEPPSSRPDGAGAAKLTIGLIPERNVFEQRARYRPLCAYLSKRLDIRVELRSLPHYQAVVEEMRQERLDGAFFGSYSYVLAHETAGASIIARPEWKKSNSHYRGLLFASTRVAETDVASMKGLRLALVSRQTTAGHLFPVQYFRREGVRDLAKHFKQVFYAGSHDAAVWAVVKGQADVGACKDTVFRSLVASHPKLEGQLKVVAQSAAVPSNGLGVSRRVDPSVQDKLRQILLRMHEDEVGRAVLDRFGAKAFIKTTDADYWPVYEMAREIGETFTSPTSRPGES
jgi:phosphonate transport system substrate-binding protein